MTEQLAERGELHEEPDRDRTLVLAMANTRTRRLGPAARPVVVPEDLDVPSLPKASGEVELPVHIRWNGPPITYDLNDRADRARVYEQVLREGTESDIRYYIAADQLRELFDELVLPAPVRRAWEDWLRRHGRAPASGHRGGETTRKRFPR